MEVRRKRTEGIMYCSERWGEQRPIRPRRASFDWDRKEVPTHGFRVAQNVSHNTLKRVPDVSELAFALAFPQWRFRIGSTRQVFEVAQCLFLATRWRMLFLAKRCSVDVATS